MRKGLILALLCGAFSIGSAVAHADVVYNLSYNDGTNVGTGTITIDSNGLATGGSITLSTGTYAGTYSLLVSPNGNTEGGADVVTPDGFDLNYDDLVDVSSPLVFTVEGLVFTSASAYLNLYDYDVSSVPNYELDFYPTTARSFGPNGPNFLTLTPATAPTPEPSSIALLGTGVLGLGGFVRRRFAK